MIIEDKNYHKFKFKFSILMCLNQTIMLLIFIYLMICFLTVFNLINIGDLGCRALHGSPMGPHWKIESHWGNCKYLFSNQILSDKVHIVWKLLYFCIDSNEEHCNIEIDSRFIWGFLKSFQFKCFEISLIFHGLLLWLQKKI